MEQQTQQTPINIPVKVDFLASPLLMLLLLVLFLTLILIFTK